MATFENEFGYEDIKKEIESYKPVKKKSKTCELCSTGKAEKRLKNMDVCEDCYDMENDEVFTE